MEPSNGNGWVKQESYVLHSLDALSGDVNILYHKLDSTKQEIHKVSLQVAELRSKIAVWGGIFVGAISIVAPVVQELLKKFLVK